MPFRKASYKVVSKATGRVWNLAPYQDRTIALAIFNGNAARREGMGPFKFQDLEADPEYYLVEIRTGSETQFSLQGMTQLRAREQEFVVPENHDEVRD